MKRGSTTSAKRKIHFGHAYNEHLMERYLAEHDRLLKTRFANHAQHMLQDKTAGELWKQLKGHERREVERRLRQQGNETAPAAAEDAHGSSANRGGKPFSDLPLSAGRESQEPNTKRTDDEE